MMMNPVSLKTTRIMKCDNDKTTTLSIHPIDTKHKWNTGYQMIATVLTHMYYLFYGTDSPII